MALPLNKDLFGGFPKYIAKQEDTCFKVYDKETEKTVAKEIVHSIRIFKFGHEYMYIVLPSIASLSRR